MAMDPAMIDRLAKMREPNGETCQYCAGPVLGAPAGHTVCRECYYRGLTHEEASPELMAMLKALPFVSAAYFQHTGGGCWGVAVELGEQPSGAFMFLTEAYKDASGEWEAEATIPEDTINGGWCVSISPTREAWENGEYPTIWRYAQGLNELRQNCLGALTELEAERITLDQLASLD